MAQQLTAAQKAILDLVEPVLEEILKNGAEQPPATNIVTAIEGYSTLDSVNGVDVRPQVKDSFKAALAALMVANEDWHLIGTGGEPAFGTGWTNYDSGYNPCAFYRDAFNRIHVRGLVKPSGVSASGQIFLLPVGYRPPYQELRIGYSYATTARIDILATGSVNLVTPGTATDFISLDGLSFRAT